MKSLEEKNKFIQLRSKNLSFDRISKELNISKPTLIKWDIELKNEISNMRYLEFESIIENYRLVKLARQESLALALSKAIDELRDRSFEQVSTKDLVKIIFQLEQKLKKEAQNMKFHTGEYEVEDRMNFDVFDEKILPLDF